MLSEAEDLQQDALAIRVDKVETRGVQISGEEAYERSLDGNHEDNFDLSNQQGLEVRDVFRSDSNAHFFENADSSALSGYGSVYGNSENSAVMRVNPNR